MGASGQHQEGACTGRLRLLGNSVLRPLRPRVSGAFLYLVVCGTGKTSMPGVCADRCTRPRLPSRAFITHRGRTARARPRHRHRPSRNQRPRRATAQHDCVSSCHTAGGSGAKGTYRAFLPRRARSSPFQSPCLAPAPPPPCHPFLPPYPHRTPPRKPSPGDEGETDLLLSVWQPSRVTPAKP